MKEVIERCNWLVNKCEDKAITPDVKDDISYLLEEIERLKEDNEYLNKVNIELSIEKNRLTNVINELGIEANKNIQVCNNRGFNLISNIDEVKSLDDFTFNEYICYLVNLEILDKLQSLKGDSSNEN